MAPRKTKALKEEIDVLTALQFIAKAQTENGAVHQRHSRIINNYLMAYDGVLAAGFPIKTELPEVCPNTYQFIHALQRASEASAITIQNDNIVIRTNKFKAEVPCVPSHDLLFINPDQCLYPLNGDFVEALKKAAIFTKEGAQTVVEATVILCGQTVVGTNRSAMIEVWHGVNMPYDVILPKTFIDAISKITYNVVGFGFSDVSFTIYYDNGSWIKTQRYIEKWPDLSQFTSYMDTARTIEIPKDFWEGIKSVNSFSEDTRIYFDLDFICSHKSRSKGAEFKVKGVPSDQSYNYKNLMALENIATHIDFTGYERAAIFFGDKCRGLVSKSV